MLSPGVVRTRRSRGRPTTPMVEQSAPTTRTSHRTLTSGLSDGAGVRYNNRGPGSRLLPAPPTLNKRLAFCVIMVIGVLLAAEAMLRVLALSSRSVNALLSADPVHSYLADRALLWRGNPEYPEHDRLGFRNPDVPSQVSIVALGDSQTYGARVSRDQAWPQQLQRAEKSPTYNMAFPGWGPPQSLLVLDQAIEMN